MTVKLRKKSATKKNKELSISEYTALLPDQQLDHVINVIQDPLTYHIVDLSQYAVEKLTLTKDLLVDNDEINDEIESMKNALSRIDDICQEVL